jgi:peptide/nickel transport system substrate-binding protein
MHMIRWALFLAALAVLPAEAKTLRFAAAGDAATLDPHSQNVATTAQLLRQIYEPLVNRDRELKLEPGLALSWSQVEPTRWRFQLRPGVTFHDGAAFTADDVVFSLKRTAAAGSNYANFVDTVTGSAAVDPLTVDILTSEPDPVLIDKLASVMIMNKAWAEKNGAELPQNFAQKQQTFSSRNANGTGPYRLQSREPDVRTVLVRHPGYWGRIEGNVDEYVSLPISANATRVAALLSGEVDFVLDPPLQDIGRLQATAGMTVLIGPEIRTMFLVMDQGREQLATSSVKGRNPFKDRRVRQALYQAIDIEAIKTRVMRGYSVPTALLFPPGVHGHAPDLDQRLPFDRAKAKALLTEAGYPEGFDFTLDCSNNRYVNDEAICQALVAMWAQIGVKVQLNALPLGPFFAKVQSKDTSMFMLGSGPPTLDAFYSFQIHALSPTGRPGDAIWNLGGYKNPEMDRLVQAMRLELDPARRDALIRQALELYKSDVVHLPLHHQVIPWAMRGTVHVQHRADNQLEAKWVTVD